MNRALHFLLTLFITLQFIVQPVQGAVHGGDAFETHKPHRTTSAAIGGRNGGTGCASGAVSGIVQSFYASTLDGVYRQRLWNKYEYLNKEDFWFIVTFKE